MAMPHVRQWNTLTFGQRTNGILGALPTTELMVVILMYDDTVPLHSFTPPSHSFFTSTPAIKMNTLQEMGKNKAFLEESQGILHGEHYLQNICCNIAQIRDNHPPPPKKINLIYQSMPWWGQIRSMQRGGSQRV